VGRGVSPRPKRDHLPAGITRRASGGYQAQAWSATDRRRVSRTFPTLSAARTWKRETEQAFALGARTGAQAPRLRDAAREWLDGAEKGAVRTRSGEAYRASTLRGYKQALDVTLFPALGPRRLSEITPGDLHRLVQRLSRDGHKPSTVRNALLPLRAIFRDAVAAELVHRNPCAGLRLPVDRSRRDHVVAPADATVLLATLPERDRALWATAMFAGLRRGELMALCWSDVDLDAGKLRVERAYDPVAGLVGAPKSRAGLRVVPIPSVLGEQLATHEREPTSSASRSRSHGRRWRAAVARRTGRSTTRR
jgi:integrase